MGKLIDTLLTNDSQTENGMTTNSTSLNSCVDLFFKIGALRGEDKKRKISAFSKAFGEDPLTAMKILFWCRDIRGGAGERNTFREILTYLAKTKPETLKKNIGLIPEYGRWDDMLLLIGTKLEKDVLGEIACALEGKDGLCAKWLPRGNGKNREKKRWASAIRKYLGLEPKAYRKLLAELSNTVEQLMCSKRFEDINYSHVPSKAMSDYMTAFNRNDSEGFNTYLESLKKGETKINTGAVYPYDITKNLKYGNSEGATEQWKSLPNYMEGSKERILPVVDVSGSMEVPAGNNPNITCMDVAISLGLYISERNEGPFKDAFFTFSSSPKLEYLKGDLVDRYEQLSVADWGGSTNLEATFKVLLKKAVEGNLSEEDMPTTILILSDMEFNSATAQGWGNNSAWNPSAQKMIETMYKDAGFNVPKIVYWNIQSRQDNIPVRFNNQGTALVSGFSSAILTALLSGNEFTPYSIMMDVINSERYNKVSI
jgi:hypothetical protein